MTFDNTFSFIQFINEQYDKGRMICLEEADPDKDSWTAERYALHIEDLRSRGFATEITATPDIGPIKELDIYIHRSPDSTASSQIEHTHWIIKPRE